MTEDIGHQRGKAGGRFHIAVEGGEAEITYRLKGGVMTIDHTFVPVPARGGDVAMRLVRRAVAEAQSLGLKIAPDCPYVARVFDFMPEWAPLRA